MNGGPQFIIQRSEFIVELLEFKGGGEELTR